MKKELPYIANEIADYLGGLTTLVISQLNEETIFELTEFDVALMQAAIGLKNSIQDYLVCEAELIEDMNRSIKRLEDKLIKD